MSGGCDHVQYSQILNRILFTDFTPSRKTRTSTNPILQEHFPTDEAYYTVRRPASLLYQYLEQASNAERKLRGKYVQVEFADSYPGTGCARSSPVCGCSRGVQELQGWKESSSEADGTYAGRRREVATSLRECTNGTQSPLFVRRRTERRRTAFRKQHDTQFASVSTESGCSTGSDISLESRPLSDVRGDMDVESSVVMYHDRLDGGNPALQPMLGYRSRPAAPEHFEFALNVQQTSRGLVGPMPFQLPAADLEDACESAHLETRSDGSPFADETMQLQQQIATAEEEDPDLISSGEYCSEEEYPSSSDQPTAATPPLQYNRHRVLSRQSKSAARLVPILDENPPLDTPHIPPNSSPISAPHQRPLPPPKAKSHGDIYAGDELSPEDPSAAESAKSSSESSPTLCNVHPQKQQPLRLRSVSFLDCSAGADLGHFPADYLGCKPVDSFIGYADSLAKGLINSKPIEVVVYVTSEKLRLAPPKNASVLFKSFAVKDILSVQKCSKNRRIVCVAVWKSKKMAPQCHALRCPSALVSNALYDSILDQTQNVDDIASDKVYIIHTCTSISHVYTPYHECTCVDWVTVGRRVYCVAMTLHADSEIFSSSSSVLRYTMSCILVCK